MTAAAERSLPVPTRTQKPFLVFFFSPVQLRRGMMEWLWWEPGVQLSSAHHSLISVHKPSLNTHFLLICNIPPHPSPPSLFPLQKPFPVSSHCRPLILEILLFTQSFGIRGSQWQGMETDSSQCKLWIFPWATYTRFPYNQYQSSQAHLWSLVPDAKGHKSVAQERK